MRSTTSSRDVEGVAARPRRVRVGEVERVEVVAGELDLGALGDPEAEADEDVLDVAPRLGDQVQVAGRARRRAGQRHVDAVAGEARVELGPRERARARLDQRGERLARGVRARADRGALARPAARRRRAGAAAARRLRPR